MSSDFGSSAADANARLQHSKGFTGQRSAAIGLGPEGYLLQEIRNACLGVITKHWFRLANAD